MPSGHNEYFEILKVLVDTGQKYSIRKLSQIRKINYKSAYNAVMKLEKEGAVTIERMGNANICSLSRNFSSTVFAVENERRKDLIKDKNFLVIYRNLSEIPFPLIVLLFGSHAKRTAGRHSDIDLLAITENKKEVESAVSLFPLDIHLTTVTPKEFISMAKSSRESLKVAEILFAGNHSDLWVIVVQYFRRGKEIRGANIFRLRLRDAVPMSSNRGSGEAASE